MFCFVCVRTYATVEVSSGYVSLAVSSGQSLDDVQLAGQSLSSRLLLKPLLLLLSKLLHLRPLTGHTEAKTH